MHSIKLQNNDKTYTTWSNLPEADVYSNGKWKRAVLLLHGFPDTHNSYKELWNVLLEGLGSGVLLLAPRMRGYEPSSQWEEDSNYQVKNLVEDVKAWITAINPDNSRPVHLIGHDWGAIAAFRAGYDIPELITSMVTLAIPYIMNANIFEVMWYAPKQPYYSTYMFTMQFAHLYQSKLTEKSSKYLDYLWQFWSPSWKYTQEDIDDLKQTLLQQNVVHNVTAYYRCLKYSSNLHFKVNFDKVPTLILGGEEDGCMHQNLFYLQQRKLQNKPNVKVQVLSKVGHFLHREDPQKVGELAVDWFNQYNKNRT